MARVSKSKQFDVPAEEMWERIGDFHGVHRWHPAVASSESLEGGSVRALTLGDGGRIVETLLEEGESFYSYRIDESPLPLADHSSTIRVRDAGNGSCAVEWDAEFQPAGAEEAEAVEVVEGIFQAGLDAL